MKQLKRLPEFIRLSWWAFCDRPALRNILLTAKFINVNIAYTLGYALSFIANFTLPPTLRSAKAVMEQSVRFRRGSFIQLPVAHRTAEHLPVAGTFQSHRSYSGIHHSHSGQFLIGALRFQTKRLMYSNRCFLSNIVQSFLKYNIFAKYLSYTLVK